MNRIFEDFLSLGITAIRHVHLGLGNRIHIMRIDHATDATLREVGQKGGVARSRSLRITEHSVILHFGRRRGHDRIFKRINLFFATDTDQGPYTQQHRQSNQRQWQHRADIFQALKQHMHKGRLLHRLISGRRFYWRHRLGRLCRRLLCSHWCRRHLSGFNRSSLNRFFYCRRRLNFRFYFRFGFRLGSCLCRILLCQRHRIVLHFHQFFHVRDLFFKRGCTRLFFFDGVCLGSRIFLRCGCGCFGC